MEKVGPQIDAGMPFIFLEPSCASVFKDELLEFFPKDDRAQKLSRQTWLLADWLAEYAPDWTPSGLEGAHVLVHGHCHHKAVFGGPASETGVVEESRRERGGDQGWMLRDGWAVWIRSGEV